MLYENALTTLQSTKQIFLEKLLQLEKCTDVEQKRKIEEMKEFVYKMSEVKLVSVFNVETYNIINKMIEEKKLLMENVLVLLKHVEYNKTLMGLWSGSFETSSLNERLEKMILEEEQKKEEKNEKLMIDLCECYLFLNKWFSSELLSICIPCLLKVASKKEENEETQNEVEMALLALSNIRFLEKLKKDLFLNEIKEIIQHHQLHYHLSHLAYQLAWWFLINRCCCERSLEDVIVNELHFAREAKKQLNELTKYVDWTIKNEKIETEEDFLLMKWLETFDIFLDKCKLWNEECSEMISNIVQIFRDAMKNYREISYQCIELLRKTIEKKNMGIADLLKCGAFNIILEEIQRQTLDDYFLESYMKCFLDMSRRLKSMDDENEEAKRKTTKMAIHEKMEEEGYEDTITCFHGIFDFLNKKYYRFLSLYISDYFVNA